MEPEAVESALDALEAEGARLFDAASCDCVRALLTRGEELGGEVRRLLAERAATHVERLRSRFDAARARTRAQLSAVEAQAGPQPSLHEALARGDVVQVGRALRKLVASPRRTKLARRPAPLPSESLRYEDSLAELVASFALARAVDVVPEHAGPYNPLRIASELLERMRTVSPIYLTAQLNRLEELASLLELPELPEQAVAKLPRKKRALKGGS